ncbi:hypothetical protein GC163_07635 [bacterium]|nr:hypothetical protein [bacterium]
MDMEQLPADEDEQKLNRRLFLQYSASGTLITATAVGIALKSDAIAQQVFQPLIVGGNASEWMPYPYHGG